MSEEIHTGIIKYFDWQKGEGRLIQEDGSELFFSIQGARIPIIDLFNGVRSVAWKKPAEDYPRGRMAGKEILYKIHLGPRGNFAKRWMLKEHYDSANNE